MPTLILPPRITDDSVRLWRAAGAAGWETLRLGRWAAWSGILRGRGDDEKGVEHTNTFVAAANHGGLGEALRAAVAAGWDTLRLDRWKAPEGIHPEDIVVYGSYFSVFAQEMGIMLFSPPVDWLAKVPRQLTQRTVRFMPLKYARQLSDRAFYKPADDKCFLAKVYNSGSDLPGPNELPDDVPVLISDIVHWEIEFRCFVSAGKVVTMSPYLRNHEKIETAEGEFVATAAECAAAEAFATRVVATPKLQLPSGVVIDVGLIKDRGWAVIEANPAWAAGIYGCDPAPVLPILRDVCRAY